MFLVLYDWHPVNLSMKSESLKVVAIPATVPFFVFCIRYKNNQTNLILTSIELTLAEPKRSGFNLSLEGESCKTNFSLRLNKSQIKLNLL